METKIDNVRTIEAVRKRYGSVREFCRQADVAFPHFYMIVNGTRGVGDGRKGPKATRSPLVIQRLREEGLLIESSEDVVNG